MVHEFWLRKRSLKDELLVDEDEEDRSDQVTLSGSSGSSGRWTERQGLKKISHLLQSGSKFGGKRSGSIDGVLLETVLEEKASEFVNGDVFITCKVQKVHTERFILKSKE